MTVQPRSVEAFAYAEKWHRDQVRKGAEDDGVDIPYMAHILGVTSLVMSAGGDEDEVIAALLHDVPEDHGGQPRLDEIRAQFGDRVAGIVEGLSDHLGPQGEKGDWRARKEAYIAHVRAADRSTQIVCAADKLHNLTATLTDLERVGDRVWNRFNTGREGQQWYYEAVCSALEDGPASDCVLVGQLRGQVDLLSQGRKGGA